MNVAVDASGGDFGPGPSIQGALLAAERFDAALTLIGQRPEIESHLRRLGADADSVTIEEVAADASQDEPPAAEALRRAPAAGCRLVKAGQADAFVSGSDTGAVFLMAVRNLGRIPGVQRPCIAAPLPTPDSYALLLDAGANPECQPEYLVEFALMGATYARLRMGVDRPRVFLLSNGREGGKGTELTRAAHVLLAAMDHINYQGYAEPYLLGAGPRVDVLVADGFSGNVLVKGMETASRMYAAALETAFRSSALSQLGYGLARPALEKVKRKASPQQYGGAVLLGVNGVVTIAHGANDAEATCSAIRQAMEAVEHDVVERLSRALNPAN